MNSKKALIYTTIISYIMAGLYVLVTGVQFQAGIHKLLEGTMYIVLAGNILVAEYYENKRLKTILVCLFGLLAPFSFSGLQKWINYSGTTSLGPFMALWDIAMAIALLEDV